MDIQQDQPVIAQHVESKPAVCGGKPCVAGTRIRVWDIHVWHDLRGQTPAEIITHYPQLTLADVHAALAFYYDHRDEIEAQIRVDEALADEMAADQGPTPYTRIRDAVLGACDGGNDSPVSS